MYEGDRFHSVNELHQIWPGPVNSSNHLRMPVPHGGQGPGAFWRATYAREQGARELNHKRLAKDFEVKGSRSHVKNGPTEDGGIVGDNDLSVGGTVKV
jgi:hypothetical protein